MRSFALAALCVAAFLLVQSVADACQRCGSARCRCTSCAPCQPAECCAPCQPPVEYEERKITVYDVKFREVSEEKVVKTTKFVADTEERDVTMTCTECKVPACGPVNTCGPAACCEQVPVTCVRKAKFNIVREVPSEEKVKVTHIVEERTPRTIVCKVPKTPPCAAPSCCDPAAR
jgi:hypothetical protein